MKIPLIILLLCTACQAQSLVQAIEQVESGGDCRAIGDKGRAVGCLQIWEVCVRDVNRISGKHYAYKDRYSREKSYEMFKIYTDHYASKKRLGRKPTNQDRARVWNGGPNGYKKKSTIKYWNKVRKELSK